MISRHASDDNVTSAVSLSFILDIAFKGTSYRALARTDAN